MPRSCWAAAASRSERLRLARQALALRPGLERRVATPHPYRERIEDRAAVARDDQPAQRQQRLQPDRGVQVGCPHRTLEQRPRRARLVAPNRVPETAAAGRGQRVLEPADVGRRAAARCLVRGVDPFADRELPALAAEAAHGRLLHDVGPRELAQRGLDRRPEPRIHAQVVVHAPSADAPGRPGDAARLLVGQSPLERREPAGRRGQRAAGGRRPLARGTAAPVGGVRGQAGGLSRLDRRALLRLCGGERARGLREGGLELRDPRRRRRRPPLLVAGSARRVVDPPARRLGLAGPCRLRAPHGRQLVATGAARGAERAKLRQALGERPVGVGERGLQREIRLRDGLREARAGGPRDRPPRRHARGRSASGRARWPRARRSRAPRAGRARCARCGRPRGRRAARPRARSGPPSTSRPRRPRTRRVRAPRAPGCFRRAARRGRARRRRPGSQPRASGHGPRRSARRPAPRPR